MVEAAEDVDVSADNGSASAQSSLSGELTTDGARSYKITYSGDSVYVPLESEAAHCEVIDVTLNN